MKNIGRWLWNLLVEVPIFGPAVLLSNAWLFDGSPRYRDSFPGPLRLILRLGPSVALSSLVVWIAWLTSERHLALGLAITKVPEINLTVFPSVLGFGLAIFLILFTINKDSLSSLSQSVKKSGAAPAIVSVQLVYPIVVFSINILMSSLLKILVVASAGTALQIKAGLISLFLLTYSFASLFDVLLSVYLIASKALDSESEES